MRKKDLFYISNQTTYGDLQELLREELHSSYPLIDHPDTRVLLGSVKRDVLKKMLRNHLQLVHTCCLCVH
jgi:CBS domain containing-hemolysin-like protein